MKEKQPQSCHNDSSCQVKATEFSMEWPFHGWFSALSEYTRLFFIVLKINPERELNLSSTSATAVSLIVWSLLGRLQSFLQSLSCNEYNHRISLPNKEAYDKIKLNGKKYLMRHFLTILTSLWQREKWWKFQKYFWQIS